MARARNLKPSLFKNELLGVADPHITILFTSLWCLADREGRLEDRPLRIKAETFPYRENLDINGYLTELQQLGFIRRYKANGNSVIQIINFKKHQAPHHTEKASELPPPNIENVDGRASKEITVNSPLMDSELTVSLPPDSLLLIPDSLLLIPECVPTESDSELLEKTEKLQKSAYSKPTKININFSYNQKHKELAEELGLAIDLERDKFVDYYLNKTNKKFLDWDAAFRNWLRKAAEFAKKTKPSNRDYQPAKQESSQNDEFRNQLLQIGEKGGCHD